jgi:hypothetical protein
MTLLRDAAFLLASLALAGWAAERGFRPVLAGLSRAERLAWSLALGMVIEIVILLAVVAVGARPGPLPMAAGLATVLLASMFQRAPLPPAEERLRGPASIFVAAAAAAAVFFAIAAISEPMWSNDFLAIWGLKGKTIALAGGIPGRLFHDPMTRWSHPEYPLFVPLALAASAAATGSWNDQALALLYPVFQIVLLAALYGATKRRSGPVAGSLAALLAACFFGFFRAFAAGMADVPLAALLVLFAASMIDFVDSPSRPGGARLALSSFLCAATKQEGSLFVLLACAWAALVLLRRDRARPGLATIRGRLVPLLSLTAVPVLLHELVLTAARGRIGDRDYDWTLLGAGASLVPRAAAVAKSVLGDSIRPEAIPLLALAGFLALASPRGGARTFALLGPPLAAQLAVYAAVCVLSAFDPRWQAQFLPRLAATLFPVLLLAAGPRLAFVAGSHRETGSPDAGHADPPC